MLTAYVSLSMAAYGAIIADFSTLDGAVLAWTKLLSGKYPVDNIRLEDYGVHTMIVSFLIFVGGLFTAFVNI